IPLLERHGCRLGGLLAEASRLEEWRQGSLRRGGRDGIVAVREEDLAAAGKQRVAPGLGRVLDLQVQAAVGVWLVFGREAGRARAPELHGHGVRRLDEGAEAPGEERAA